MSGEFWTDCPIAALGDTSEKNQEIRKVEIISYDGRKHVRAKVGGIITWIKSSYVYTKPLRYYDAWEQNAGLTWYSLMAYRGPIVNADNTVAVLGEPLSAPVVWIGRQWAVTSYGVECRDGRYSIDVKNILDGSENWEAQMSGKGWVDMPDFLTALMVARGYFSEASGGSK